MRYGVAIPHANRFATPSAIRTMARAVEELGYDSIWVSDHVIVPEGSSYIPEFMDEPLATLAYLAGQTTHVKIGVSVLIVPYRDPVFTAKFLSTVDLLSNGRLIVGTGSGWMQERMAGIGLMYYGIFASSSQSRYMVATVNFMAPRGLGRYAIFPPSP